MNYLIGYDISDNKIREVTFNKLKYLGYINIQKSIFFGFNISNNIYEETKKMLENSFLDSYFIVKINSQDFISNIVGYEDENVIVI
ncbi:CRISPR-associated endonuclease Cas2 [Oceanivirga salmonicida]|uniref:CRISPR-associated endonuclease Cas2 n=1 Tax=Oceanivirga salmonicida TaxID=1769291 RepID=UPI0012E27E85|nr:CRISPR-associated endonuclease Cas2 [Oceanivirga salmonicida]